MALRPVRTFLAAAAVLVPVHVVAIGAALILAGRFAGAAIASDGALATLTSWTGVAFSVVAGFVFGTIAGLAAAMARTVATTESEARAGLLALSGTDIERRIPSLTPAEARERYESILDRLADEMLGRIRVPRLIRRLIKRGLRQAPVEDFIADCEARELETVGFIEARNWLAATGLPYAFKPIRAQIRLWQAVSIGIPALLVIAALIVGLMPML